ncbi:MAG: dUTP diphosphatase [Aeromonadaceae bacterium]
MIKLKVKRMTETAKLPTYAHDGDACFDIYSDGVSVRRHGHLVASPHETHSTGLSFDIPKGYAMMVYSRSGMGFNNDVRLANCVGVIDSGYKGELKVKLTCDGDAIRYEKGDRIAQAMLIPVPVVEIVEVDDIGDSERGVGGLGSSGK